MPLIDCFSSTRIYAAMVPIDQKTGDGIVIRRCGLSDDAPVARQIVLYSQMIHKSLHRLNRLKRDSRIVGDPRLFVGTHKASGSRELYETICMLKEQCKDAENKH